jgi:hypothetical protein
MDVPRKGWRHPALLGLLAAWLVGMLWWAGLMIAFALTDGPYAERPMRVASLLAVAPLVALPWAVVGLIVGAMTLLVQGKWIPAGAAVGAVGGAVFSLVTSYFDGWLALTMPANCFVGAFLGLVVGGVCGVISKSWAGHRRRLAPKGNGHVSG